MSSAFQQFYDALIQGLTVLETTTCVNVASLTLLTYDWMLNLSLEIALVWRSRPSLIKFLYLITRYLAFGDVTLLVYEQVVTDSSAGKCTLIFHAFGWMFTTGFVLGELLLVTRTWAVWGRDFRLGCGLITFYLGLVVAIYINMGLFLKSIQFIDGFPGIPGCIVVGSSRQLYIDWVLLMVLDIGVCSLMIIKGCKSYVSGGNSQLMKVVYGEGIMYYVYLVVLSMINVILILKLSPVYLALLSAPMRAIHSILTCRVVLHTRRQGKINTVILGENIEDPEAAVITGPTETLRFLGTENEPEEVDLIEIQ